MVNPLPLVEMVALTNGLVKYYTSPAQVPTIIKKCTVTNADAVNGHTVTIELGTAAGGPVVLINQRAIGPLQTLDVTEMVNHILAGGDSIHALADAGAVLSMRVSGVQIA